MQSCNQIKTRSTFLTLAGLALAGALSACGGGSTPATVNPPADPVKPVDPPATSTTFERSGLDVQLFSNTPINSTGFQFGATIDSSANITLVNSDHIQDHPAFNYSFTFPSGLPGGSASGNLFNISIGSANKDIYILTPSKTKNVQNVLWRGKGDPTLFGVGAIGYSLKLTTQNWPASGNATYSGKAFQYIVDSNAAIPADTTYALYTSDVIASVDYSAKTISIAVAPNPAFINSIGNPDVISANPNQFAANYALTNLDLSGETTIQHITQTQPHSGLGLPVKQDALTFFGSNAEELGGFIQYSGDVTTPAGVMTRDQFVSFALVKQ